VNLAPLLQPFRRPQRSDCFLLVTYDSCRYDTYAAAKTPVLDRWVEARCAWSQATYTYPSHMSMFQGMLPHVFEEEEYYNRFVRQVWRRGHRTQKAQPLVLFPHRVRSIIDGFNRMGYFTCATAAMSWFKTTEALQADWQRFLWTGIHARRQVEWTIEQIEHHRARPFFAFINFGETHAPYRFDDERVRGGVGGTILRERSPRCVKRDEWQLDEELWQRQVQCVEYLDARMGDLLDHFGKTGRDVTVVFCGDHGDCMGEDGLWGHGIYHPKVMEVPMGVFQKNRHCERITT
jgi:arylsulfatase A-like enzyme